MFLYSFFSSEYTACIQCRFLPQAVDEFSCSGFDGWLRLHLFLLLLFLQNQVSRDQYQFLMSINESLCNYLTILFLQNVRSLPNGILFRLHGVVQLSPGYYVRNSRIHWHQRVCAEDIFHCQDRLRRTSLNIVYTIIGIVIRTM